MRCMRFMLIATSAMLCWTAALAKERGLMIHAGDLLAEPFIDAAKVGSLGGNQAVTIVERRGGWLLIEVAGRPGWVRMLNVRLAEAVDPATASAVGHRTRNWGTESTAITIANGSKGFVDYDPVEDYVIMQASINRAELAQLEEFGVSERDARQYAVQNGLKEPGIGLVKVAGPSGGSRVASEAQQSGVGLRAINEQEEIKIGGDLAGMLLGGTPLLVDPVKQRYLNTLGMWLAMHSGRPELPWKFGIIDSNDFNAFSAPGGYVLITRGLLERMRNESELAGILGHEIAHVVRKHHLAMIEENLSVLRNDPYFYDSVKPDGALLEAAKYMYILGLQDEDEYEADRIGVVIAARSGYSPYGLVGVLQTLTATTDEAGFGLHYRTHPLPLDRLGKLDIAMGPQFEKMSDLADDLPAFARLQKPPPATTSPVRPAAPTKPQR